MANVSVQDLVEGDIMDILGLDKLPEKEQEEVRTKMLETINNRVLLRIADLLDEAGMKQWETLLDEGDDEKIRAFLTEKKIDMLNLIAAEALVYKSEMADMMQKIKE